MSHSESNTCLLRAGGKGNQTTMVQILAGVKTFKFAFLDTRETAMKQYGFSV